MGTTTTKDNSQDVGQDSDGPHVGVEANRFSLHDFRGSKLCCCCCYLDNLIRIQLSSEAKVDDLDVGGFLRLAHYIFGLKIDYKEDRVGRQENF